MTVLLRICLFVSTALWLLSGCTFPDAPPPSKPQPSFSTRRPVTVVVDATRTVGVLPAVFRAGSFHWYLPDAATASAFDTFLAGQKAQAVIEWAKALCDGDDVNDYLFNLSVLARMGYIQFRHTGLAASLVNAYERETGILAERLAAKEGRKPSEHQGTAGEKLEVVVKVNQMVSVPGYAYNSTRELYIMGDENGNVFTWTTQGVPLDEGATYRLVGKVKEHSEYHGSKQTRLTRCKVLETLEASDAEG